MSDKAKVRGLWIGVVLVVIIAVFAVIYGIRQGETEVARPDRYVEKRQVQDDLSRIIGRARTWRPAFREWYGERAEGFTLVDLEGEGHSLGDYLGREVMVVFWATWCRPCVMEVPHLVELRKSVPKDELAILGVSYIGPGNSLEDIRAFVSARPAMNYTILPAEVSELPPPFNSVNAIPTSFFIDKEGRIKLATSGLVSLPEMRAIVEAK